MNTPMECFGEISSTEKPKISSIAIPEAKKIRQPTKHYVYKIVVQWSNGSSTVIYRRYSMFFDFQVKLQELYLSLKEKNALFQGDTCPALPELPGKVLFGRTQVHQVAEKRRVKIEEFCEALVSMPSDISQSSLVLSFFNTWPEDTLHHSQLGSRDTTSPVALVLPNSPTSPTSVINHPDEMENLEQYRVVVDYDRRDNHQVDLVIGQIVHVIEKHDTGWWMVVTEDEQGYAPAAHLDPIDKTYDSAEPECSPNEEYEVMDTFKAENEDEIELARGERVVVLYKSMDGWWKIKTSHGRVGFCPATILRSSILHQSFVSSSSTAGYESDTNIYEGMHFHKPPPRRSTLQRNMGLNIHMMSKRNDIRAEDPQRHYQVPRSTHSASSGSDEGSAHIIDLSNPPFSPDHYELGPCFNEQQRDNGDGHVYENTQFPTDAKDHDVHSNNAHIYQNMEFEASGKKSRKKKEQEDEYINPEEFVKEEGVISRVNGLPNSKPAGYTPVSYKQVTIAEMPLSPPSSRESSVDSPSHSSVMRAKLTSSKSLGFIDTGNSTPDEEYVEMDPIYAPVAPDEPPETMKDSLSGGEDTKSSLAQSLGGIVNKKKTKPHKDSKDDVVPRGRVLERTKSLEDLLSMDGSKKNTPGSPTSSRKVNAGENTPTTSQKVVKNEYDRLEIKSAEKPTNSTHSVANSSKKPEPAKKKPYYKSVVGGSPSSPGQFRKVQSPPVSSPPHHSSPRDLADGMALPPPPSVHPPSSSKGPFVPKTYIAIEGYDSQAPGCLSFNAGDRCVLVRQSSGGWWYVNIGGREGWTPGDFWEDDKRAMSVAISQPPSMAPKKPLATKPRSQTHITSFPTGQNNPPPLPPANNSPSHFETRSGSFGNSCGDNNSQKLSPKPQPGRTRVQPPPKPKPFNVTPTGGRKLEQSFSLDSTPPPPPPPRRESSQPTMNGIQKNDVPHNDYTLLEYASTQTLEEQSWFAGSMERERAEQFLMENGRQREFLVRERTNRKGYYALSIRYHYSVKHFNIDPQANGSYSMGVMHFSSIEEVVKHYQLNSLFIHDGQPVALGQPVRRKSKISH